MELRKRWKTGSSYKREIIQMCIATLLIVIFIYSGGQQTSSHTADEQQRVVEEAIKRAVVQCYAIEGMYPPDMAYLEEEYGIQIDEKKYIIHYEVFASNVMPDITVLRKRWEE